MKKLTALISALVLLLSLCACTNPGAEDTGKPDASQDVSDGPVLTSDPPSTADMIAIATELSERRAPVSELYEAIGKPLATDYVPGCVEPDSEDGELTYSGFTVYTVRTSTREYVYDVLATEQ